VHGTDLPERPADPGLAPPLNWFEVVTRHLPDATELVLIGELDQATRPIFDAAAAAALRTGPPVLRLELSGLAFLAVAGAHAFADVDDRCGRAGGRLVLVNPARRIIRLLDLFELTRLVPRA
jgi:anti-anti-sigma factor